MLCSGILDNCHRGVVLSYLFGKFWRLIKFGSVGGSVMLIAMGLLYVLVDVLGVQPTVAYVIQAVVAINLNFILNYSFTWSDRRVAKGNWRRFLRNWLAFLSTRLVTIPLNTILFTILEQFIHYLLATGTTILIVTIFNYLVNDKFVFKVKELSPAEPVDLD